MPISIEIGISTQPIEYKILMDGIGSGIADGILQDVRLERRNPPKEAGQHISIFWIGLRPETDRKVFVQMIKFTKFFTSNRIKHAFRAKYCPKKENYKN
jgi:hypothetical protein